jgi:hypothetical protein
VNTVRGKPFHRHSLTHTLILLLLSSLVWAKISPSADSKPLPEINSFLQNVRARLHSNQFIQSNYTYIEKSISRQLDSDGKVKETETTAYEVYPSIEEQFTYRKLIAKNDKPLSAEEIKKNDNEFEKKRREWERKLEREGADERQHRESRKIEEKQKEEEAVNEALRLYNITMIGREQLEGIPVIALAFMPRSDFQPKTKGGKILSKAQGKAWFTEEDQELVRIEAELVGDLSFGFGIVAKLNKGARMVFQRRLINDEVWLPARSLFTGTGRILLLKGFRIDQETIFSDYKKFSVKTVIKMESREDGLK